MLLGALPARAAAIGEARPPGATGAATTARATGAQPARRPVVLAFIAADEAALSSVSGLSLGVMSATQGSYTRQQMLLDFGQGARIASSAYDTSHSRPLSVVRSGRGGIVSGWGAAVARAQAAPQLLRPGLLASALPGGAGYVGISGTNQLDALAAADRAGRISELSVGSASSLRGRIAALRSRRALVVCDLPSGAQGIADLKTLSGRRAPGELLLVLQRASDGADHALLWAGAAGLDGGAAHELTSRTTNQRGLLAAVDLAPTILAHVGAPIPADVRGERLEADGPLHSASLRSLRSRLAVVGARRLKALACLLAAWALLLLLAAAVTGARGRAKRAWAMRVGALAIMWSPAAALVGAALQPSAAVEYATIVLVCFALAAISDALLAWPRAPLAPAIVVIVALVLDALAGTQLLVRSLLGPNPILGARFYGFGNELKSGLAVLALAGLAAALFPLRRSRRAALAAALVGIALAAVEGAARIGAGVGGVILVSAGFAVATIVLLPGDFSRRRALIGMATPLVALVALAAIDLLTAHGGGHYTGSILHARSPGDLRDVIVRRYGAAWRELKNHAMPAATALALVYGAYAVRDRFRLLAPVGGDGAWTAVLAGGLTAGVVGSLSEDSGPVLLVVAVFVLGCVASYLWGRPPGAQAEQI
ncbi:MAG: hypothetical protein QOF54_1856 [Solirubrobacteraceae bacterium]|nr:hypothetical protein [Solirubrobacteraceae bacterium]